MKSRVYKNLFSLSISQVGYYIIPLLVIPYLLRILGPEKFGAITFAQAFTSYFTLVVNYGFDFTATRAIATNKNDIVKISSIFYNVIFIKLLLFLTSTVVLILLLQIPRFNNNSLLFITTHLINIGFIFYPSWLYQGMQDLKITAILSFLIKFLYALMIICFINTEADYLLNNLLLSISQILIGLLAVVMAIKKYKLIPTLPGKAQMMTLLNEGGFFFLSTLIINVYTYTNTFLLGLLSTERETAYFNVVHRIIFAINGLLLVPFNMAFFPYISEHFHSGDYIQSDKKLVKAAYLILGATFLCGLILYAGSEIIIRLLFGSGFSSAAHILRLLAFTPMLMGLVNVFGFNGLLPLRQDKRFLLVAFLAGCMSLGLNIIFIPTYHAEAVAWIWTLSEFTICTLCFFLYKRALRKEILKKTGQTNTTATG